MSIIEKVKGNVVLFQLPLASTSPVKHSHFVLNNFIMVTRDFQALVVQRLEQEMHLVIIK